MAAHFHIKANRIEIGTHLLSYRAHHIILKCLCNLVTIRFILILHENQDMLEYVRKYNLASVVSLIVNSYKVPCVGWGSGSAGEGPCSQIKGLSSFHRIPKEEGKELSCDLHITL